MTSEEAAKLATRQGPAKERKAESAKTAIVRAKFAIHLGNPGCILIGMLPIWLVTTLPTWLVIFVALYALAVLYVAIKFREVRKFLAGGFFVSSGILWYLWLTGTSIPLVIPYVGTVSMETPDISGQRAIVHFILFLLCFYFGFISSINPLYKQLARSSVIGMLVMLALIFIPAGTFQYWQGWAYVAVFIICSGAYTVFLAKHDPALLKRRSEAGISHEKEFTQKVVVALLFAACFVLVVLPPLDVRFGWSLVPWQVSIIGNALVALSFYIFYLVSKVNTYAAANVRVEEGQKVISTGVYGLVRHPMYFAALFLLVGTPLALGSLWTLFFSPVFVAILVARILNEEKVLARDLTGYVEYTRKVRYRLIPSVW
ncbi:MAG TPA: isoprenylcysteine carboxylmethyltransferase family protein [Xanthobacteraceae bacterium]